MELNNELCEVVSETDVILCHTFEDCRSERGPSGGCYRRG